MWSLHLPLPVLWPAAPIYYTQGHPAQPSVGCTLVPAWWTTGGTSLPSLVQAVALGTRVVMLATSPDGTRAGVAARAPLRLPGRHPWCPPSPELPRGTLGTVCEQGWLPVVAEGAAGLSLQCLSWGRSGPTSKEPLLSSLPPRCSQPSKRLVQFVTLGPECTVCFIWPLSSPTLAALYLYFLLQPWHPAVSHTPALICPPPPNSPRGS